MIIESIESLEQSKPIIVFNDGLPLEVLSKSNSSVRIRILVRILAGMLR